MSDFMQMTQNVFISWILSLTHLEGEGEKGMWDQSMFGLYSVQSKCSRLAAVYLQQGSVGGRAATE
jgi:hypothetical protein